MPGRRFMFTIGGTRTPGIPSSVRSETAHVKSTPVMIPKDRCVYWYVGCEEPRYLDSTMCRPHLYEAKGWKGGKGKKCPMQGCDRPANRHGGPCRKCYKKIYNNIPENADRRRRMDQAWRARNVEKARGYRHKWWAKTGEAYRIKHAAKERERRARARRKAAEEQEATSNGGQLQLGGSDDGSAA